MNEVRITKEPYSKLPYELQRYMYSFIYPDVRLAVRFPDDDSIYDLIDQLVDTYKQFSTDVIGLFSKLYYKYFPDENMESENENELILKYKYRVFDKDDRGRHIYWYEETPNTDYDEFIYDLSSKIIFQKNNFELNNHSLYKLLSSYQYHLHNADEYFEMLHNQYDDGCE